MDEPSVRLAPTNVVAQAGDVIVTLTAAGVTVVLVEQNLAVALRVAGEVAAMTWHGSRIEARRRSCGRTVTGVRELLGVGTWHVPRLKGARFAR